MPDLRDLRDKWRNLKSDFDRQKEIEFARQSAVLNDQIDREVWRLRDTGMSIAKIGAMYGSKNYGTIREILDRRPTAEEAQSASVQNATINHRGGDRYVLSVGMETVEFDWDFDYHAVLMFHGDFNPSSELVAELRKENNAYAAQIEAI